MSDTADTGSQTGGAAAPESAALDDETAAAPAEQGAETETTEATQAETDDKDRAAKRIRQLAHRYAGEARRADELAARVAQLEAAARGEGDDPARQADIRAEAARLVAEERSKERIEAFHEAGRERFGDQAWQERCQALMAMGADAGMSQLLVEMKDGAKVAASLHDDPDELERIARLSTPTARAIALGVYAGRLEAAGNGAGGSGSVLPGGRSVSRTPAPIRPVQGRAQPVFNEYTATSDQLTEYYAAQARKARGLPG